jgi:shikimate dehydrogenase
MSDLARIPLAGVIGSPIAHSKSPRLHGYWLNLYGIRGHYIPMDVAPGDLPDVIAALPKAGFVGCNVTIPHKEAVLALADIVTDRAALIGAANTLIFRRDGRIHADNTDGYGFTANLRQNAPNWQPVRAGGGDRRGRRGAGGDRLASGGRSAGNPDQQPHQGSGRGAAAGIRGKDRRL